MIYTKKIKDAIKFATKTHEGYQKQKRKGKDMAYIAHPITVGLILSLAGANEDVIIAGILHDTIEDSTAEKKVTTEMLTERFGKNVADLVLSVTEQDKTLSWEDRKKEALKHIKHFSRDSLLVKSADTIGNVSELLDDYDREGDKAFASFNAPKEKIVANYLKVIGTILECLPDSPLAEDLRSLARGLQSSGAVGFMSQYPAQIIDYADYREDMKLCCPVCGWKGTPKGSGGIEYYDDLLDVSCPNCEKMLIIVSYPLIQN